MNINKKELPFDMDMIDYFKSLEDVYEIDSEENIKDLQVLFDVLTSSTLTKKQYAIYTLKKWGLTFVEIAEMLGEGNNTNSVARLYYNSLKRLDIKLNETLKQFIDNENFVSDLKVKFYNRPRIDKQ